MTQKIARIYPDAQAATKVGHDLRALGFSEKSVHVIVDAHAHEPMSSGGDAPADHVLAEILEAGVSPEQAAVYADAVHRGQGLVVVQALFGSAATANRVMDEGHPVEIAVPEARHYTAFDWDSPTPLSSAMGWRLLLSDPAPLSRLLGLPTIKHEPETSSTLTQIQKQSTDAAPLSKAVGMAVLSDNEAPLTKKFKWRLLLDDPAPLSTKFGWKLLSGSPTPLSDKLGMRVLSRRAAPLSDSLGLPVVKDD